MRNKFKLSTLTLILVIALAAYSQLAVANNAQSASASFDDVKKGRETFLKYDCHACHRVAHDRMLPPQYGQIKAPTLGIESDAPKSLLEEKEEEFRKMYDLPTPDKRLEKYVMAIVNPNHTIAPGFAKGSVEDEPQSDMPDYVTEMTIQEMRDIVAYLMQE